MKVEVLTVSKVGKGFFVEKTEKQTVDTTNGPQTGVKKEQEVFTDEKEMKKYVEECLK